VLDRFFLPGGIKEGVPFKSVPMFTAQASRRLQSLAVVAGFVEVFLAKQGHRGSVGINFLQKVELPTPAILYGALLAGVDYVLVGAGIPRDIPSLLDRLVRHADVQLPLNVTGARADDTFVLTFDPSAIVATSTLARLRRPRFLAIVSSATLAASLARHGRTVDGFVVESPDAGGHNAPPRGRWSLNAAGEPAYGPRDAVDPARMREIGLPFWLAGRSARPQGIAAARAVGAAGIQVGTLFAFCEESGIDPSLRAAVLAQIRAGTARVVTDPFASPTGFPFKVVALDGTLADAAVYETRERRCDLGYLRELYRRDDGTLGYRCPGEPVEDYLKKGGRLEDTTGRKCLCNGLLSTVGIGQRRGDRAEPPIVTAGTALSEIRHLLCGRETYSAADVVSYLTQMM
jgi:NAD(P)H-dependent flavin oxidoreductase YrpB (nitropropane dioxygenase family)